MRDGLRCFIVEVNNLETMVVASSVEKALDVIQADPGAMEQLGADDRSGWRAYEATRLAKGWKNDWLVFHDDEETDAFNITARRALALNKVTTKKKAKKV